MAKIIIQQSSADVAITERRISDAPEIKSNAITKQLEREFHKQKLTQRVMMRERLINWGRYHQRDTVGQLNHDSGKITISPAAMMQDIAPFPDKKQRKDLPEKMQDGTWKSPPEPSIPIDTEDAEVIHTLIKCKLDINERNLLSARYIYLHRITDVARFYQVSKQQAHNLINAALDKMSGYNH